MLHRVKRNALVWLRALRRAGDVVALARVLGELGAQGRHERRVPGLVLVLVVHINAVELEVGKRPKQAVTAQEQIPHRVGKSLGLGVGGELALRVARRSTEREHDLLPAGLAGLDIALEIFAVEEARGASGGLGGRGLAGGGAEVYGGHAARREEVVEEREHDNIIAGVVADVAQIVGR